MAEYSSRFQPGVAEKNMRGTVTWSAGTPRALRVSPIISETQPAPQ